MASPVLSVQKHTLTLGASITSPTLLTFTATTPPNVQMTKGAGTNLPSMVVGERFAVENHDTHNGNYEVVTVTTEFEDYVVESLTGSTDTAGPEQADIRLADKSVTADLTGSPDITNCIPFTMTRVVTSAEKEDDFSAYAARADFVDDTIDKVRITTNSKDLGLREIVCEITVVEFNPTEVNVYQGADPFGDSDTEVVFNDPYGVGVDVDLNKSFLYFNYDCHQATEAWKIHTIRGVMTDADTLTFDAVVQQGSGTSATRINWYVAEAINTAWSVQASNIQLAAAVSSNTDTITAVADDKTFILGSYKGSDGGDQDSNEESTIDVTLDDPTPDTWDTVDVHRSIATAAGVIDWAGFVVTLAGNENVYRGTLTASNASPDPAGHTSIGGTVAVADSWAHSTGSCGNLGSGSHTGTAGDEVPDVFSAWTFFSTTQLDSKHYTTGGATGGSVSWEVIEWDVGGAAPPRRVMVVS